MDLTDVLAGIPESIWGIIVGALLTLIPVIVSNRHSRKQQAQQLQFESTERQRERRVNLRRDVYLPAADAIVGMTGAAAKLLGGDPSSADQIIAGSQAFGAALTRIQMVATPETVRRVGEYQRAFLKAISLLQRLNHPMMLRKADIDLAHSARQAYHKERMKFIELRREYHLSGVRDPQRLQGIEQQAAFIEQRHAEEHSECLRLMLAQETSRLEMFREFGKQMTELAKLQAPVLAAIRSELEAGDESALIESALIEGEARKTAVVGLQTLTDMVPLLENSIEGLRSDVEADEQRRRRQLAQQG
jgi:hypothetical protein